MFVHLSVTNSEKIMRLTRYQKSTVIDQRFAEISPNEVNGAVFFGSPGRQQIRLAMWFLSGRDSREKFRKGSAVFSILAPPLRKVLLAVLALPFHTQPRALQAATTRRWKGKARNKVSKGEQRMFKPRYFGSSAAYMMWLIVAKISETSETRKSIVYRTDDDGRSPSTLTNSDEFSASSTQSRAAARSYFFTEIL